MAPILTQAQKAHILDWLCTPRPSGRADRPPMISRDIDRVLGRQALVIFRAWGTKEEVLAALEHAANKPEAPTAAVIHYPPQPREPGIHGAHAQETSSTSAPA
jgi:hypothetical protein